jgi:hypothetical protein
LISQPNRKIQKDTQTISIHHTHKMMSKISSPCQNITFEGVLYKPRSVKYLMTEGSLDTRRISNGDCIKSGSWDILFTMNIILFPIIGLNAW